MGAQTAALPPQLDDRLRFAGIDDAPKPRRTIRCHHFDHFPIGGIAYTFHHNDGTFDAVGPQIIT